MPSNVPAWMRYVLAAAALVNVAAGVYAIAWPASLSVLPQPVCPEIWQCMGVLMVGYGIACAGAVSDPYRHWPVIMAGLFAKISMPALFIAAAEKGSFPWIAGLPLVFTDVIWWVPFSLMLWGSWEKHLEALRRYAPEVLAFALRTKLDSGVSIEQLSSRSPVLMVFLRHSGCMFCRQSLSDISKQRQALTDAGLAIVLVHMADTEGGRALVSKYGLGDLPQISDPGCVLYRGFGLRRCDWRMFMNPRVWWRGALAVFVERHFPGRFVGDLFQMPGVFLLFHGQILRSYRHKNIGDRPDYARLAASGLHEAVI